jgi:hypothetical protein
MPSFYYSFLWNLHKNLHHPITHTTATIPVSALGLPADQAVTTDIESRSHADIPQDTPQSPDA